MNSVNTSFGTTSGQVSSVAPPPAMAIASSRLNMLINCSVDAENSRRVDLRHSEQAGQQAPLLEFAPVPARAIARRPLLQTAHFGSEPFCPANGLALSRGRRPPGES